MIRRHYPFAFLAYLQRTALTLCLAHKNKLAAGGVVAKVKPADRTAFADGVVQSRAIRALR